MPLQTVHDATSCAGSFVGRHHSTNIGDLCAQCGCLNMDVLQAGVYKHYYVVLLSCLFVYRVCENSVVLCTTLFVLFYCVIVSK